MICAQDASDVHGRRFVQERCHGVSGNVLQAVAEAVFEIRRPQERLRADSHQG